MLVKIKNFIMVDIWRIRLLELPRSRKILLKSLMVFLLATRRFNLNMCYLRASALTFYSLLSTVPVLAMAFGITKGFGFEKMLQNFLLEKMPGQEKVVEQIIIFAQQMLNNTKGGLLAGIGIVVLLWSVIKLLGNIERSFNDIWQIKKIRSVGRIFTDYLAIVLLGPLLLVMSSGLNIFVVDHLQLLLFKLIPFGAFVPIIISVLLELIPYCVIWALLTFVYIFLPNHKVNFKDGLIAGIISGTLFLLVQWGYVSFQVGVAHYNTIYGSFAALPLFLIWLQISWLIVLFGAEISYASQNLESFEFSSDCSNISYRFKTVLTLYIFHEIADTFLNKRKAYTAVTISRKLKIPISLVRQIINDLMAIGLLSELTNEKRTEFSYQPAYCTKSLTIKDIIEKLETKGVDKLPVVESKAFENIIASIKQFDDTLKESPSNMLINDL